MTACEDEHTQAGRDEKCAALSYFQMHGRNQELHNAQFTCASVVAHKLVLHKHISVHMAVIKSYIRLSFLH